jgi:putative PIN family toxin of toxin-antitoxin system
MNITAPKLVLDTNILVAIVGRRSPYRWIFDRLIDGKLGLCISNEILLEYREVLERKTSTEVAKNVIDFLIVHPATTQTQTYFNFGLITEDADDNKFVDCAIAANARAIVSNDRHFQILKTIDFPRVSILTLVEFEKEFR